MATGRQRRREEREKRERGRKAWETKPHTQQRRWWHTNMQGHAEVTQKWIQGGGEAGTSQLHSRHKNWHMTSIYLTDSDEEATVDFDKDHEEFYDKTKEQGKDKARKEWLLKGLSTATGCLSKCVRLG